MEKLAELHFLGFSSVAKMNDMVCIASMNVRFDADCIGLFKDLLIAAFYSIGQSYHMCIILYI